jgi:hypothetical protein
MHNDDVLKVMHFCHSRFDVERKIVTLHVGVHKFKPNKA